MAEPPAAPPASSDQAGTITVLLGWSPAPREVRECPLRVPRGSTVGFLLAQGPAQAASAALAIDPSEADVGVWGRRVPAGHVLREGDRIELYRPLTVDPKYARRERFRRQGARTTGLFATRRAGGKAGY